MNRGMKIKEVRPKININELSNWLRVSKSTIYRWLKTNQYNFPKPTEVKGNLQLWDSEEIHNWILSNRV